MAELTDLAKFLFEVGQLKRVARSGWTLVGVNDPESVAEHSFRTAIIGFVLARLEGADAARAALVCLFHDVPEARLTDLHHLAQRYTDWPAAQERAVAEIGQRLPPPLAGEISELMSSSHAASRESRIARDADRLELMLQASEYRAAGHAELDGWIARQRELLETDSAKRLAAECLKDDARRWWIDLLGRPDAERH